MKKTKHTGIYYRLRRDGSKTFYLRLKIGGRQTWLAVGARITDAKELWNRFQVERAEGKLGVVRPKKIKFRELAAEYFEHYKTRAKERNWGKVHSTIKQLDSYFGSMEISKITSWTVENYVRRRKDEGKAPGTINSELSYLSAILHKCVDWEVLEKAPKIKTLPIQGRRGRELSEHEIEYVLRNVSETHRDAINLILDTGMRLGEMFSLAIECVDMDKGIIYLDDTKSLRPREIPMTARAREILSKRFKEFEGRLFKEKSSNSLAANFSYERKNLTGIPPWRFHDLRHTFVTRLIQKGTDPYTVMELAGHHDLKMTTRYLHTNAQRKKEAIERLENIVEVTKKRIKGTRSSS